MAREREYGSPVIPLEAVPRARTLARASVAAPLVAGVLVLACAHSDGADPSVDPHSSPADASIDRARLEAPLVPDASCHVVIETPPLLPSPHVPEGTAISYNSNPPSSGPHYPLWASFQEFQQPVPRPYLVHSMEHGAVVMLYKCADPASCAPVVDAMRKIRDALPTDPSCPPDVRVRIVIAPDPAIDTPVAAAAWGWTYKSDCLDATTLGEFVSSHYRQGTEDICAPGKTTF